MYSAPTVHIQCMHCTYTCTPACIEFIRWQHSVSTLMSECFSTSGRASWIFCITLGGRPICGGERRAGGTANDATAFTATGPTRPVVQSSPAPNCMGYAGWGGVARQVVAQHASMPSARRTRCYQSRLAASDSTRPARRIGRRRETASQRGSRASAATASQPRLPCDERGSVGCVGSTVWEKSTGFVAESHWGALKQRFFTP